jgi:hypothetical protein
MQPRRILPYLVAVSVLSVLAALGAGLLDRRSAAERPVEPSVVAARAVLAEWDADRAAAWSAGDAEALADLYADGSRAGARDVGMLARYAERGLRVEGMQMQVVAFEEVDSRADRLVLRVTDRVVGAVAVGEHGRTRLPSARPVPRRITFVRQGGRWVVDSVAPRRGRGSEGG